MKISIIISLLIITAAALIGWRNHREISVLRVERETLSAEAAALGIPLDDPAHADHAQWRTKRERADKLAVARRTALDIIGIAKELNRLRENGEQVDIAMQDRILEGLERIRSMNTDQLMAMIAEFRIAEGVDAQMLHMLQNITTDALADRNPRAALQLLAADGDPFVNPRNRVSLILKAVANWAEADTAGALAWMRANRLEFMDAPSMELALVEGAARTSPTLAFGLISELEITDAGAALSKIASNLREPGERTELLGLLRHASDRFAVRDMDLALANLGIGVAKGSYEEGVRWIEGNNLSEREIERMIHFIGQHAGNADKGQWIEWMGDNLSADSRDNQIGVAITYWTRNDHRAAGEWLAALPDGPAKPPSVAAFALAVAPHDPDVAEQWARTLPPGGKREAALREIDKHRPQEAPETNADQHSDG